MLNAVAPPGYTQSSFVWGPNTQQLFAEMASFRELARECTWWLHKGRRTRKLDVIVTTVHSQCCKIVLRSVGVSSNKSGAGGAGVRRVALLFMFRPRAREGTRAGNQSTNSLVMAKLHDKRGGVPAPPKTLRTPRVTDNGPPSHRGKQYRTSLLVTALRPAAIKSYTSQAWDTHGRMLVRLRSSCKVARLQTCRKRGYIRGLTSS